MSEENYDLKKSKDSLGPLIPILRDAKGNIIDGFHRAQVYKDWPSITLTNVDNTAKAELVKLAVNFCRRTMPKEELDQKIGFLIGAGFKPEEIAEKTGMGVSTVYKHMPQAVKDEKKVEAGSVGGKVAGALRVEQTVKTSDMAECERCHVNNHLVAWNGHALCSECRAKATANPTVWKEFFDRRDRSRKAIEKLHEQIPKELKPTDFDTAAMKEERRHPKESEMDREMHIKIINSAEIRELGYHVDYQKPYYYAEPALICRSDVSLVRDQDNSEVANFYDTPKTHPDPEGDREKRERAQEEQLKQRIKMDVFAQTYEIYSDKERDRLFNDLLEHLRQLEKWKK